MSRLVENFSKLGEGIKELITGTNSLYAIYFIVFLLGTYALFNKLFQDKITLFSGKAGKVLAFMISIITTGAVFYGSNKGEIRTSEELLYLFNGFGGFIILLAFSIGIFYLGYSNFTRYRESNKNVSYLFLFGGIYLSSSILKTVFITEKMITDLVVVNAVRGYMGYFQPIISEPIFYILDYASLIGGVLVFVYLFLVISGLFSNGDTTSTITSRTNKNSEEHDKRIKDLRGILNYIQNDFKDINIHFNNQVNILNDLRREIGRLRNRDAGGNN